MKIISETEFMKMCDRTISSRATPAPPRAKVEMPPKPKRLPEPADDEDDDDPPAAASEDIESSGEAEETEEAEEAGDDGPFAKYGPVTWRCKLENEDEGKFWNIEVRGKIHVTVFGKLGSPGQTRLTDVGSATAAKTDAEKRAVQKRKEGYE
jgi:predicted DNA-binding WGR domain protein